MKKIILFVAMGVMAQAYADDIQVQMVGNIFANTCVIDSASKNLTVDLGQAASSNFKDVGDTGEWKDFSLSVSH
ncbi:type 1 fimbrial protein, partial [Enterobacter sp. 63]